MKYIKKFNEDNNPEGVLKKLDDDLKKGMDDLVELFYRKIKKCKDEGGNIDNYVRNLMLVTANGKICEIPDKIKELIKESNNAEDVYNLHDIIYTKIKSKSKFDEKTIKQKVDNLISIISRHYDEKPSKEQLEIEINRQLD